MDRNNNTKTKPRSERALLPLLIIYLLASGSVYEKVSAVGGGIMLAIGVIMGAYAYLHHKSILKQSYEELNQPLDSFIWNTYIPFLFKHWRIVIAVILVGALLSTIYISKNISNKTVQLGHASAAFNLCLNSTNCPPLRHAS